MSHSIDMGGPAAASAITAAVSIITEVIGRSSSRPPSKDASNQLAVRTGELARVILEAMHREPAAPSVSENGAAASSSAVHPLAPAAVSPVSIGRDGW